VQVGDIAASKPSRPVPLVAVHFTVFCVQIRGQLPTSIRDGITLYFAGRSSDDDTIE